VPARTKSVAAAALAVLSVLVLGAASSAAETRLADPVPPPPFSLSSPACSAHGPLSFFSTAPAESVAPKAKPLRAWLEMGAVLAYSTASYWHRNAFPEDWQFHLTLHDQFERVFLLKGWRFDSNNFQLNWSHALAGGLYYQFARGNNLSWGRSWLMAIAASTYWEAVVEWREVISLNDQITTGLGAYATGEPWYQIGHYLAHRRGVLSQVLSFLNPIVRLNHWFDRKQPGAKSYEQPGWHDLSLFVGGRSLARSGHTAETSLYFGLRTELLMPPDYGQPGEVRRALSDTCVSGISLDYAVRNGRADETNFRTSVVSLGAFRQAIDAGGAGHALIIGLGSSFEYFKKRPVDPYDYDPVPVKQGYDLHLERPRDFTDKLALVHLAGPVVDWTVFRPRLTLRTVAEAYFDFGLVNSYALNAYSGLHHTLPDDTIEGMKTTVMYYGYYYAFGGTLCGRTCLDWGRFRLGALASFGAWSSVDVLDRFDGEVTNNAHLGDDRWRYLVEAGWRVPGAPVEIFARYEGLHRFGRVLEARAHGLEKRFFAGLELGF
jgi:hypothetical protein